METMIKLLADGLMLPIGAVFVYAVFWRAPKQGRYDICTRVFMAGITSYIAAKLVGALWQPEAKRPFEVMGVDAGASSLNNPGFPSDHALFATFLTWAVWYVTRSTRLTLAMAIMTALVCLGRILALVHTPLDIAGGILIGSLGALWYLSGRPFSKNTLAEKSKR